MTELIKLFSKDFFPNLKDTLTEASGVNGDTLQLPDGEDLGTITNTSDEEWNTLFKKYLNFNLELYVITVKGFKRKTPINGEPQDGFIKLTGETTQEEGRRKFFIFGKRQSQDVIKADQIEITADEANATLFKKEDLNTIVSAIKKVNEFNLKETKFEFKRASSTGNINANYPLAIMKAYFAKLCGNPSFANTLNAASNVLMNICRKRQNPLVGNPLFDVLKAIMINPDHSFEVSPISIITLNNILADRILTAGEIVNPKNILGSLPYNRNLYNLSVEQIKDLFEIYWKARNIDVNKIPNPALDLFKTDDGKKKIQKNLLIKAGDDDADVFRSAVSGKPEDPDSFLEIGWKPEGDLIRNLHIRTPAEAQALLDAILGQEEHEEDDTPNNSLFLQLLLGGDIQVVAPSNFVDADDEISARFNNVEFKKGMTIRLVKTFSTSQKDTSKPNLLNQIARQIAADAEMSKVIKVERNSFTCLDDFITSVKVEGETNAARQFILKSFKFTTIAVDNDEAPETEEQETETPLENVPEGYEEVDPDGTTVGDQQQDVTVQVGDKVVGLNGQRIDVTEENIGQGKWNIQAGTKIWRLKPQPADTTTSTGEAFVGGKTLNDISRMSKEDFRTFSSGLTPEEKAKLKALGGKLLAAK